MKRLVKEFFFLTRGERRALLSVSVILICSVFIRVWIASKEYAHMEVDPAFLTFLEELREEIDSTAKDNWAQMEGVETSAKGASEALSIELAPFMFNPNTISEDSLRLMHTPEIVVSNLIKYRDAGGIFRKKEDVKKIYGLSDELYRSLNGYVSVPSKIERANDVDSVYEKDGFKEKESLMLSLNEADTTALWQLSGIGVSYARRIVKYRDLLGGYCKLEQLLEVYGMDSVRYELFCSNIFIDSTLVIKLDLNSVDFKALISHPYISREMCYAILQYRDYVGQIMAIEELKENEIIDHESLLKLWPYLEVKFNKD